MKNNGHQFLKELSSFPPNTFESSFSKVSARLSLGQTLTREELACLYAAAYQAALCNIALNGLGGCAGQIRPDLERNRTELEISFMAARARFFDSGGWRNLSAFQRGPVERIFLHVCVQADKLAI
jgi:hypothetical protein